MAVHQWYATSLDSNGTALADSQIVSVWVDTVAPPAGSNYDIVII